MITVQLPRAICSDGENIELLIDDACETVRDVFSVVRRTSPGVADRILDERGNVRQHVNVFVRDENIRFLNGLDTATPSGSTVFVIAAISGG